MQSSVDSPMRENFTLRGVVPEFLYTANNQFARVLRTFLQAGTSSAQFRRQTWNNIELPCRLDKAHTIPGAELFAWKQ